MGKEVPYLRQWTLNNVNTLIIGFMYQEHWQFLLSNYRYPPGKFKVLAFTGAPGSFPVRERDVHLQKYVKWSNKINEAVDEFLSRNVEKPFLGIHMRNGVDWVGTYFYFTPQKGSIVFSLFCSFFAELLWKYDFLGKMYFYANEVK